jgi:hypothetical protein
MANVLRDVRVGQGAERCRNEAEATLPYRYLSRTSSAQILNRRSGQKNDPWTRLRSGASGSRIHAQVTAAAAARGSSATDMPPEAPSWSPCLTGSRWWLRWTDHEAGSQFNDAPGASRLEAWPNSRGREW